MDELVQGSIEASFSLIRALEIVEFRLDRGPNALYWYGWVHKKDHASSDIK